MYAQILLERVMKKKNVYNQQQAIIGSISTDGAPPRLPASVAVHRARARESDLTAESIIDECAFSPDGHSLIKSVIKYNRFYCNKIPYFQIIHHKTKSDLSNTELDIGGIKINRVRFTLCECDKIFVFSRGWNTNW